MMPKHEIGKIFYMIMKYGCDMKSCVFIIFLHFSLAASLRDTLPGIPTRSRAFSLQRNNGRAAQNDNHDVAVFRSDNAYESPPDEVESHAGGMINRVTLGPPDGDLYASIPDDIGLQRGSAEKLSNNYTYPPFEDHALAHATGQSLEFQMKKSTEVPETRPAGRVEADVLGPLAGDSYTCVPGRTALANFVSAIDTDEPLSIRKPT